MPQRLHRVLWAAAVMAAVCAGAFNLVFGDLNQDEGWYLYAARMVAHGQMPYRDFAFTQGPMLPLVYGFLHPLWGSFGVAGGRVLTALLGLLACFGGAALAARLVPEKEPSAKKAAAFTAFCLIALNMVQSYFSAVVKTYSLCSLFLIFGFLLLTRASGPKGARAACGAGVCLALAAATRLSAFMTLPVALACLWLCRRGPFRKAWLWFAGAGLLTGAAVFLPFFLSNPDGFLFGLLDYHAGRSAGGWVKGLIYKGAFFSRFVQAYFPALTLWVAAMLADRWMGNPMSQEQRIRHAEVPGTRDPVRLALWGGVVAMTLIHLTTAFPYDDYQVPVYPLLAVSAAAYAIRLAGAGRAAEWIRGLAFASALIFMFGSPLNQEWFLQQRDRIWWRMKDKPPLVKLREVGRDVRKLDPEGGELLTQDVYLAVEAGMTVPSGFELGQFCYFPEFTENQAKARRVLNHAMMLNVLANSPADVAAFSGYGLAIRSPEVLELDPAKQAELWRLVNARYKQVATVPFFGQASTTLRVLIRR